MPQGRPPLTDETTIRLADGVFHNAKNLVYYHSDVTLNGTRHAYVKSSVMGNWYEDPAAAPETNYQYNFFVPIEGPFAGIATMGYMDETIYVTDPRTNVVSIVQRMISLNLVSDHSVRRKMAIP